LHFFNYAQTIAQRNSIKNTYDLSKLEELAKKNANEFRTNYEKGKMILEANHLPLSGIDEKGSLYALKGYDEASKQVLFYTTFNNTATKSSIQTARVQALHNGAAVGVQIKGDNMILGIWDGGQPLADHQNLGASRVINKDGQNTTGNNQGTIQNGINHATHVAGTMIGSGFNNDFAKGIAPTSNLWANTWDDDLTEMTNEAAQGLLVSNHSYGINNRSYINLPGFFGRYTTLSRGIDELTFNANMYLPVFAAGNDRNGLFVSGNLVYLNSAKLGHDLLTHEMVSKNAVVVAAVYGITTYQTSLFASNNVVMSDFSQWGPTDDFRIKPDISAKGVSVYSSTGTSITSYSVLNGTSMAAPAVSAVFILWQQIHHLYYPTANNNSGFMKAASLKALMAHSASEAGEAEGPDSKFGWGLIDAKKGAEILKESTEGKIVFKELNLLNYQQYEYELLLDGTQPLTATIAWTDRSAQPVAIAESPIPVLINDLDLRITKLSTNEVFYPWKINKSWSNLYTFKGDNDVDPIEQVTYFDSNSGVAPAGTYKVTIKHKNELVGNNQNFSLIISGGIINANQTVSTTDFDKEKIFVFPNPAVNELFISDSSPDAVVVYDMLGNKIKISYEIEHDFIKLNLQELSTGSYYLHYIKNKKVKVVPFIKH